MISKFRPPCPIIGCSPTQSVLPAAEPVLGRDSRDGARRRTTRTSCLTTRWNAPSEAGCCQSGDLVVITAGVPLGISGTTNLLKVHIVVGNILVAGHGATTAYSACGNLCVA